MIRLIRAAAGALALVLLAGCATTNMGTPGDPLERVNRATYRFNNSVDKAVLRPVARGYREHVPEVVQRGIDNFLENLAYTTTIVNDLLQLKIKDTLTDIGRFTVNSTLGIGGILDPATHFGIPKNDEDFGQTLGRWGVPAGPFVVIPFLGPSSLRDAPSLYVDTQTDFRFALDIDSTTKWALAGISLVNRRAELLPYDVSFDSAYDRYALIRNAWLQRREYQVKDGEVEEEPIEDPDSLEPLEDPAPEEDAKKYGAPLPDAPKPEAQAPEAQKPAEPEPEAPPAEPPPADQPRPGGEISSATSLIPASEAIAGGTFR
ncbi:MAG TPA: VacJ family lipoprotein [Steroidobacteraceae bacterium]|jgi:phospholipid-binding lipoprotein MlaA|nr:VacJ family lipoprotein [Steroidobacteraceae bacterium]